MKRKKKIKTDGFDDELHMHDLLDTAKREPSKRASSNEEQLLKTTRENDELYY